MPLVDPPAVPEGGTGEFMKAKDLKNRVIIVQPTAVERKDGIDGKPWEYVVANVWVLETHGVVEVGQNVRFSWWKAREQLRSMIGEYVACKPVEQDDNSVELIPLQGNAREVASGIVKRLEDGETVEPEVF